MTRAIAVLRPEPGNAATALRIEALGRRALRLPLFAVHGVTWSPPDPAAYDSLLLTSANALRHGGPGLAALIRLPVHAVGGATADAARAAGFSIAAVGDAGVAAMRPPGRVLRLVGRDHHAFAGADTIVVYASAPLHPDLAALAGSVALIHSPRAARALAANPIAKRSDIAVAAIGAAAVEALGAGWRAVAVAEHPTDAALIAAAIGLAD